MSSSKANPDSPNPILKAHLRIARTTTSIPALLPFYINGLGFTEISSFTGHNNFDGIMLGHASLPYHLEFTTQSGAHATTEQEGRAPSRDNLLVFYLPEQKDWEAAVQRMEGAGFQSVKSENPWWDQDGKGRTYEDAEGWRAVLWHGGWGNSDGKAAESKI